MRRAILTSTIEQGDGSTRTQKDEVIFLEFGLRSDRLGTETGAIVEFKSGHIANVPLGCIKFVNEAAEAKPNID